MPNQLSTMKAIDYCKCNIIVSIQICWPLSLEGGEARHERKVLKYSVGMCHSANSFKLQTPYQESKTLVDGDPHFHYHIRSSKRKKS